MRGFQPWRKHFAVPAEHGAWIWWIGPLAIGASAGGAWGADLMMLFAAALAAFLSRQPASIAVKASTGRRPRADLAPALFWLAVYAVALAVFAAGLLLRGHVQVLALAPPGAAVFVWHLWLVARRAERGQMGVELVGAGVLALAAPAAYWVSGGTASGLPWILWALCWLQSAASIVYVYLRLEQRRMDTVPPPGARWRAGWRTLLYHGFNLFMAAGLAAGGYVPILVPVAFGAMLADAVEGVARTAVGLKPAAIGLRQLAASSVFVVLMLVAFQV